MKWVTAQPLTGGMAIAAWQVFKTPPEFIITSPFGESNTQECINYFNKTLKLNVPVIMMDAKYEHFLTDKDKQLFESLNKDIDVVNYLPICSGLSALTTNCSKCKEENEQNDNQYQLTKMILEKIKPKVAVYENAPALYTPSGAGVLEKVRNIAKDYDYSLTVERVDTYNHGIPQHRQRTFAYFWKSDTAPYLEYENIKPKKLSEYLKEIPKIAKGQDKFFGSKTSHKDVCYEFCESLRENGESMQEMINRYGWEKPIFVNSMHFVQKYVKPQKAIKWGEEMSKNNPPDETKKHKNVYEKFVIDVKRIRDKLAKGGNYFNTWPMIGKSTEFVNAVTWKEMVQQKHPTEDRTINLREYAHLMGMPHDFDLENWDEGIKLSQNVPVGTSRHVAEQCKLYIEKKLIMSNSKFIKQSNIKQKIDFEEPIQQEMEEW